MSGKNGARLNKAKKHIRWCVTCKTNVVAPCVVCAMNGREPKLEPAKHKEERGRQPGIKVTKVVTER